MSEIRFAIRAEHVPWYIVAGTFLVLSLLIGVSIGNYVSVAEAHVLASFTFRPSASFVGLAPNGTLASNGTVVFILNFTIINPSSRDFALNTVAYKVWLEDGPQEAGLPNLGRVDVHVTNDTGSHEFFRTFLGSVQVLPFPVSRRGDTTYPFMLQLTRASDPARFAAVQNITEYAVRVLGGTSKLVWNVWALLSLDIQGVPSPPAVLGDYLLGLSRVVLVAGWDLEP